MGFVIFRHLREIVQETIFNYQQPLIREYPRLAALLNDTGVLEGFRIIQ
jgi:hypothetical protein